MAHFICEKCGKGFKRCKQGNRLIRFCSQKCYHAWRKDCKITPGGFQKKSIPWNKGLTGIHFSPGTEFKKGSVPATKLPVGSVRIRKCKGNKMRAFVKVAEPNVWKLRCYVVWEKAYGKIPKGLLLHHNNRDTMVDDLTNLALINRAAHINEHRPELLNGKIAKKKRNPR